MVEARFMVEDVLVIGGGVAGIQAALDLADRGLHVYMVEKEPSIGGTMALLDKTFPTNDCSICILAPKMNDCAAHQNIDILDFSEVVGLDGEPGNFQVTVRRKARYVDPNKCNGCGVCFEVCPAHLPNKSDQNLAPRGAIYKPFPQAVPNLAIIDREHCINCGLCKKYCEPDAINFEDEDKDVVLDVGALIVATGLSVRKPQELKEYGYGKYLNVYNGMEYERLICASGPTHGHLQSAPDNRRPKKIAIIQCVGIRDTRTNCPYCASVCCLYATKSAMLAFEHYDDIESYIFYTDLRAFSKLSYEYTQRAAVEYNVTYINSKPGRIREDPETRNLIILYVDDASPEVKELEVEMVILSMAIEPVAGTHELGQVLKIDVDEYGFIQVPDPDLRPCDTTRSGVFVAGYIEGPKDITESVAQASGAAAKAAEIIAKYGTADV